MYNQSQPTPTKSCLLPYWRWHPSSFSVNKNTIRTVNEQTFHTNVICLYDTMAVCNVQ